MPTLLVPTDFSRCARVGMRLAAKVAPGLGADVVLLHVTQLPPGLVEGSEIRPTPDQEPVEIGAFVRSAALAELERYARELRDAGLVVSTRVELGDPLKSILAVADSMDASMIVMGTHGRTGLAHLLLGSVAEKVIRESRRPVLTVPGVFPDEN